MTTRSEDWDEMIVLLGPQPRDFSDLAGLARELQLEGPVALITAAWQENESDDGALTDALGLPTVNLELHRRSEDVVRGEPEFIEAWTARQKHLRHLQEFYRLRLEAIDDAAMAINVRHVDDRLIAEQSAMTVSQLRHLDEEHLRRCSDIRFEFDHKWNPGELPTVKKHRQELAAMLTDCASIVISGGHVVALVNRLRLFDVLRHRGQRPILAWSAGAMALTDQIVLFHDSPPFGKNLAQVLDFGLGLCPGIVAMPDVSRRVHLDQKEGIGRFARRMAPAHCLALDPGARITFREGRVHELSHSGRLGESGDVNWEWTP
jgi:hypothetical protein